MKIETKYNIGGMVSMRRMGGMVAVARMNIKESSSQRLITSTARYCTSLPFATTKTIGVCITATH